MSNLCIIPARGGSKRIPRKNIKDFLGKPIIAYGIEVAIKSALFDEVMVSTDDEEIAEIAISYGALVPFRRSESNSSDFATTADVLVEVIRHYKDLERKFKYACCIYPCTPLLTVDKLSQAFDMLVKKDADTVFTAVPFTHPIQRALIKKDDGKSSMVYEEYLNVRTQDLEQFYHDAGQFYWVQVNQFLETKNIFTANSYILETTEMEVQDIDSEVDWQLAKLKYRLNNEFSG